MTIANAWDRSKHAFWEAKRASGLSWGSKHAFWREALAWLAKGRARVEGPEFVLERTRANDNANARTHANARARTHTCAFCMWPSSHARQQAQFSLEHLNAHTHTPRLVCRVCPSTYNLEVHATSAHHALHTLHAFYSLHLCSTPAGMHTDSTHFDVTRLNGEQTLRAESQVYRLRGE